MGFTPLAEFTTARDEPERALLKGRILSRLAMRLSSPRNREVLFQRLAQFPVPLLADWSILDIDTGDNIIRNQVIFGDAAHELAAARLKFSTPNRSKPSHARFLEPEDLRLFQLNAGIDTPWQSGIEIPIPTPNLTATLTLLRNERVSSAEEREWFLEVAQDISQLSSLVLESWDDFESTSQQLKSRDQLASILTHELNNSLSTLSLQLEVISQWSKRSQALPERIQGFLTGAESQVQSIARHVQDISRLSAFDSAHLSITRETFDLAAFIEGLLEEYSGLLKGANMSAEQKISRGLLVHLDRHRMTEVFNNLIKNSIKYAPGATLQISCEVEDRDLRVHYSDNGPGIPRDYQRSIFQPFDRAPRADSSVSGSGLGLFVAREIIVAHQGRLHLESNPESGTHFIIALPNAVTV